MFINLRCSFPTNETKKVVDLILKAYIVICITKRFETG